MRYAAAFMLMWSTLMLAQATRPLQPWVEPDDRSFSEQDLATWIDLQRAFAANAPTTRPGLPDESLLNRHGMGMAQYRWLDAAIRDGWVRVLRDDIWDADADRAMEEQIRSLRKNVAELRSRVKDIETADRAGRQWFSPQELQLLADQARVDVKSHQENIEVQDLVIKYVQQRVTELQAEVDGLERGERRHEARMELEALQAQLSATQEQRASEQEMLEDAQLRVKHPERSAGSVDKATARTRNAQALENNRKVMNHLVDSLASLEQTQRMLQQARVEDQKRVPEANVLLLKKNREALQAFLETK